MGDRQPPLKLGEIQPDHWAGRIHDPVDQPEDNLDNRHIASSISPVLLEDKRARQVIFTSHNANVVVLTALELIVKVESDGSNGQIEEQGFLATPSSTVTTHVVQILDGGERSLADRSRTGRPDFGDRPMLP